MKSLEAISRSKFQFTHPGRGATWRATHPPHLRQFQFTHPGRGATRPIEDLVNLLTVSIHAPREGCDGVDHIWSHVLVAFQFTHPGRGATTVGRVSLL